MQQLCRVQSGTESPVTHLPHGRHGLSGWTLGSQSVGDQKTTQTNTIVASSKAQIHINEKLYTNSSLTSVPVIIKTLYFLGNNLVCSTMDSPAAKPNIKVYFQKKNEDLSCDYTYNDLFQNLFVLCNTDVKLSCPSLQDVKELDCLNKKS